MAGNGLESTETRSLALRFKKREFKQQKTCPLLDATEIFCREGHRTIQKERTNQRGTSAGDSDARAHRGTPKGLRSALSEA